MSHQPNLGRLDPDLMANEMYRALQRQGVNVEYGKEGWEKLLRGIAEGIIVHLSKHDRALVISVSDSGNHAHDGQLSGNHRHDGHVEVQRTLT